MTPIANPIGTPMNRRWGMGRVDGEAESSSGSSLFGHGAPHLAQDQTQRRQVHRGNDKVADHNWVREAKGIAIHLFVRETKLGSGKAAPFVYRGPVVYQSHVGSNPMSVTFKL